MLKKPLVILLCCLPMSTFAAEFEFSLGAGFQYSGVFGTQFALKHNDSKYFASVGFVGYSLGMQTIIADNEYHSAGFSVGEIPGFFSGDSQYGLITYNYHLSGFRNNGLVLGAGIGMVNEDTRISSSKEVEPSSKVLFSLDVGYKF